MNNEIGCYQCGETHCFCSSTKGSNKLRRFPKNVRWWSYYSLDLGHGTEWSGWRITTYDPRESVGKKKQK